MALHDALVRAGRRVHSSGLDCFGAGSAARQIVVLAATYGAGQPPVGAESVLDRIACVDSRQVPVAVVGFGDRQFPDYCGFAEALDKALHERGWPELLPLERIHQQSLQQFIRWSEALAQILGCPLVLDHQPRLPHTTSLQLLSRRDYPGGKDEASAILRFRLPPTNAWDRLTKRGVGRFTAGDLLGIIAPGSSVPRYYSLASGSKDGFVEICVRHFIGGLCSTHLMSLEPGGTIEAFIRPNPGFVLPPSRHPVLLIGAGTGVAPLAGFIRGNDDHLGMHLYFGARDPARDYYFAPEIEQWRGEGRVSRVQTAFSRVPDGGCYVQDVLQRDAAHVRNLVSQGALVRVCGSQQMARGVKDALDGILATANLSVQWLRLRGRYAEDVF